MIGIGVVTYSRCHYLQRLLAQIASTTVLPYRLFVADDASGDGTKQWLQDTHVDYISMKTRSGVAAVKNAALCSLQDCEYIFIIEDDVELLHSGWDELYVAALSYSNLHHISFITEEHNYEDSNIHDKVRVLNTWEERGIIYQSLNYSGNYFCLYSKECINRAGGFNEEFKGYGYAHNEYQNRIVRMGLQSHHTVHLPEGEKYIRHDWSSALSLSIVELELRRKQSERNKHIYFRLLSLPPLRFPLNSEKEKHEN